MKPSSDRVGHGLLLNNIWKGVGVNAELLYIHDVIRYLISPRTFHTEKVLALNVNDPAKDTALNSSSQ